MKPLILMDFDGVLFNSAYEAYQVCERMAKEHNGLRSRVSFDDFMSFRAQLVDAWQYSRLYQRNRILRDVTKLNEITPDEDDWMFSKNFFEARSEMLKDPEWAKLMSPYPFFYQMRPLLTQYAQSFKILSTRNKTSIERTLEFFEVDGVEIYGQEAIREHSSKLGVAKHHRWLEKGDYVVYVDDMNAHLEPFETEVDLCLHAGWGYDAAHVDSYTQGQVLQIIQGFLQIAHE